MIIIQRPTVIIITFIILNAIVIFVFPININAIAIILIAIIIIILIKFIIIAIVNTITSFPSGSSSNKKLISYETGIIPLGK